MRSWLVNAHNYQSSRYARNYVAELNPARDRATLSFMKRPVRLQGTVRSGYFREQVRHLCMPTPCYNQFAVFTVPYALYTVK